MLKKSEHRNIINKELLYQNKFNSFAPRNCKNGLPLCHSSKKSYLPVLTSASFHLNTYVGCNVLLLIKTLYTLQSINTLLEIQVLPCMIAWQPAPRGLEVSGSSASL